MGTSKDKMTNPFSRKVDPEFYEFWNINLRGTMSFREFTRRIGKKLRIDALNLNKLKSKLETKKEKAFGLNI